MKKHKNLILFLIVTFLRSVFLGMSKIFLWSALKEDNRTLEEIAWYISLGTALSYLLWWALTYTFRKRPIAIVSWLVVIWCLFFGYMTDYFPFKNFAIIITIMWLFYGLWLTIKGIITTIEIMESWRKETTINGIANIFIFIWLLVGSYRWFDIYSRLKWVGVIGIIWTVWLATIITLFMKYDINFKKHTIHSAITKNIPNIIWAIKRYFKYLIPIWLLRAISTAVGQKMLEIGIDVMNKEPTKGIVVIIISMLWAILWHIASTAITKRKKQSIMWLTILLSISTMVFPFFLEHKDSFNFMLSYSGYLGFIFGIIVNLIEGKFYHKIGEQNKKEFWSAAYGLITSIVIFLVMIIWNTISQNFWIMSSFVFLWLLLLSIIPLTKKIL